MSVIYIPSIKEITPNSEGVFTPNPYYVLPFYIKDGALCYRVSSSGKEEKMKCVRKLSNYKIFAYKTLGAYPHTRYFILNTLDQTIQSANTEDATLKEIVEWVEYLLDGGSLELAEQHNQDYSDIFANVLKGI